MKTVEQLVDILKCRDINIGMQAQLPKHVLIQSIMAADPQPQTKDSSTPELQWAVLANPKKLQIEW